MALEHERPLSVRLPRRRSSAGCDGAVLEPSRKANGQIIPYVFRSAKLYSTTTIQGTPDNPTIIYLTGEVTAPTHARINFVTDPLEPHLLRPRPAGSLLIYSSMRGNAVHFPTGVQFAGGIYAPSGAFNGGSQGEIFGALVADVIRTQGGWKFHYDETTAELDGADLRATDWVEVGS